MQALEKDRTRRYGSPAEFSEDIARHIRHRPVAAGPPSVLYRLGKYVRRNRLAVAAGTLVVAALLAAILGTTLGMNRARREAETATRVAEFMETTIIDLSPRSRLGQTTSPREILDRGLQRARIKLANEPLARARVLMALGVSYGGLGEFDQARELLEECGRDSAPPSRTHPPGLCNESFPSRGSVFRSRDGRAGPTHPC